MLWSRTFIPTLRENPQEAESRSHQLLLRAGLVRMLMAGVYSYLPLGLRVLNNIEGVIRQEMDACGASELLLPVLHPLELWQRTGRDKDLGEVMARFVDRRGRKICLGPTHEEVITDLVKNDISSYKDLPLLLYQIQTKIRDELRPRFGLVRGCEFIMKDAYSFDRDEEGLNRQYRTVFEAYQRIFTRCGLRVITTEADSGVMGGKVSHEFMVPAPDGEDTLAVCAACESARAHEDGQVACASCAGPVKKVNAIEIGHIFKLGTKYTEALGVSFLSPQGHKSPVIMGCYGIGVSRLISAVIEQNNDDAGIIWPDEIAPYRVAVLPLDPQEPAINDRAHDVYRRLAQEGVATLLDDRDERPGVKFKDAELIGIPLCVVIGKKGLQKNTVEIKVRKTKEVLSVEADRVFERLRAVMEKTSHV
jgi:prolyl-tRNA synthetase